ncbi:MAG: phosphate ABC transporter substrate-binding protein PstS [Acidobacteria bacterium]|nr:phosphate ABC transporter substrate-binding protein PstS [Acidobacteriota bacterium]
MASADTLRRRRLGSAPIVLGLALLAGVLHPGSSAAATKISGAGATFPFPIYAKWAQAYKAATGVALNYQSIGSGGGIKLIQRRIVDFGASDKPLTADELERDGLVQFPAVVGGVVPVVNLEGVAPGALRLDGPTLVEIFSGAIGKWNDERIRALNPDVSLPDQAITVVYRSDGSGTTFIFSSYLSGQSERWKQKIGAATAVDWPVGVGGKGNEGVTSYVTRIPGAIGYVEHVYAFQNRLAHVRLRNGAGRWVEPSREAFAAAAAGADWSSAPGFFLLLTDSPGETSWPVTGASFILLPRRPEKPELAGATLAFFDWAYREGAAMASELDYVPLPADVYELVERHWADQIVDAAGEPVWRPTR